MLALLVNPAAGTASLEGFELHSASPTVIGNANLDMSIDGFAVRLWDATPAALDPEAQTVTVPPGGAWFAVSAASEGMPGVVNATNETALVLTKVPDGGWISSAFVLGHENAWGRWTLVVMPSQWHRPGDRAR